MSDAPSCPVAPRTFACAALFALLSLAEASAGCGSSAGSTDRPAGTGGTGAGEAGSSGAGTGGGSGGAGVGTGGAIGAGGAGTGGAAGTGGIPGSGGAGTGGGAGAGTGGAIGTGGVNGGCVRFAGSLDIDVPSTLVSGTITIDGRPLPGPTDYAELVLRNAYGDSARLGYSKDVTYAARVVPGTYDLFYRMTVPGPVAPRNRDQRIAVGIVIPPSPDVVIDVDVPTVIVRGTFRVNGAPATATDTSRLTLRNDAGDEALLGKLGDGSYSAVVLAGTYDLYFQAGEAVVAGASPRDQVARLRSGVVVAPSGTTVIDVDVPSVAVSGSFTFNGAAVTSTADYGRLYLRNTWGGDVALGFSYSGSYSTHVLPGTYTLYYQGITLRGVAPHNQDVALRSGIVLGADTRLDIDVPSVAITGALTIDGAPEMHKGDDGNLWLQGVAGDRTHDRTFLGHTDAGSYAVRVLPGMYDIYYDALFDGVAPRNQNTRLRGGVAITRDTTLDIDVAGVTVRGSFKINGVAPPGPGGDTGGLVLRTDSAEAFLGTTDLGSYTRRLLAGRYDLYYQVLDFAQGVAPRNKGVKLRSGVDVAAMGTTVLDIDVPAELVRGAITINGVAVSSPGDTGDLQLQTTAGDRALLGASHTGSYSARIVPGTYDIVYVGVASDAAAPRNQRARLGCLIVD
jgi:hypothetical protein